jgi:uncharacterized protein
MQDRLDANLVRSWAALTLQGLGDARAELDALNVFPVPDGDTGTNLFLTAESANEAVQQLFEESASEPTAAEAMKAFADGALLGARGNSGVITSQLLRGIRQVVAEAADPLAIGGAELACALTRASEMAYKAVAVPKEGTVLTVSRVAAKYATEAVQRGEATLGDVAQAAAEGSRIALDETTQQLQALKDAGVVDSGGRGFVLILEALVEAVTGEHAIRREYKRSAAAIQIDTHTSSYGGPAYEVMFLLEADDDNVPEMKEKLAPLGDSLVVVGGDNLWNVHVHVDDIGAAIEVGIEAGRPYRVKVTHLEEAETLRHEGRGHRRDDGQLAGRALIAVAHGQGVAELLRQAGVTVVMATPGRRPSTSELLNGIKLSRGREVVLLPSDGDTRIVAEAAAAQARDQGVRVGIIPTKSVVQTLAAVAVHDDVANFDDDVVSMGRAAGATRYGAITVAVREAMTTAGTCKVGDILGLVEGDIVVIGSTLQETATKVVAKMLSSGGELLTIVAGEGAGEALLKQTVADAEADHDVDVEVVHGGQPLWPLILGVE